MYLDFELLREVNLRRCTVDFKHPLNLWTIMEWSAAMTGEAGEACNVAKKIRRFETGLGKFNHGISQETLRHNYADELADTVIYADLAAAAQEIDLATAIIRKFNQDSRKHGSQSYLGDAR